MDTTLPGRKDLNNIDIPRLETFISDRQNTIDSTKADAKVKTFIENYLEWKELIGYIIIGKSGDDLYGSALCAYSECLFNSSHVSKEHVDILRDETEDFENKVEYYYPYKAALYHNLAICLYKSNLAGEMEIKNYLKKEIYYTIAESNHTSYAVDCFAYQRTDEWFLKSLEEGTISMSPPTSFNDPFDCPIIKFLSIYGDDIAQLVHEVYKECLKVKCFVKNQKLDRDYDEQGFPVTVTKHHNDPEEYLHELMWAHYADNHKGVCVKYHFRNDITKFVDDAKEQIAFFRDITYTSDMDVYRYNGAINLKDAFFTKGTAWEYENELRLLAFDPNGDGKHKSIEAKDSVAAIYFGLECPQEIKAKIMTILKGRKWIKDYHSWDDAKKTIVSERREYPIEYFQMMLDETRFGKLKAVKIED